MQMNGYIELAKLIVGPRVEDYIRLREEEDLLIKTEERAALMEEELDLYRLLKIEMGHREKLKEAKDYLKGGLAKSLFTIGGIRFEA